MFLRGVFVGFHEGARVFVPAVNVFLDRCKLSFKDVVGLPFSR